MSNIKSALSKRFEKTAGKPTKMDQLAHQTTAGALSSFSGVFKVSGLTEKEKISLEELLNHYKKGEIDSAEDLVSLMAITSEVKAINNQAIILHGERIKKAQTILANYNDGAFSTWLITTYGNRQTPYNFLQYYEFYSSFSEQMQKCIDLMPKQVIYTLATREALKEEKESFILSYNGETKSELLSKLRDLFPLQDSDLRRQKISEQASENLKKLIVLFQRKGFRPSKKEKNDILDMLETLKTLCTQSL